MVNWTLNQTYTIQVVKYHDWPRDEFSSMGDQGTALLSVVPILHFLRCLSSSCGLLIITVLRVNVISLAGVNAAAIYNLLESGLGGAEC